VIELETVAELAITIYGPVPYEVNREIDWFMGNSLDLILLTKDKNSA